MPGKIVTVAVNEGDEVKAGQVLVILEAMKMQNEIAAPSAGTVKSLHVKEKEAVASGAKLVTLAAT
jgi:biotin carboxyl carrier protein